MMAELTVEQAAIRAEAVARFERWMRVYRVAGGALVIVGMIGCVGIPFVLMGPRGPLEYNAWIASLGNLPWMIGLSLLLQSYLQRNWFPVYREAVGEVDQRWYRRFLYGYGRPLRGQWGEIVEMTAAMAGPPLAAALVWWLAMRVWPEREDIITGMALGGGMLGFVGGLALISRRANRAADAWYAAHFQADEGQARGEASA